MVCAIIPGNMDSSPIEWSSVVYRPAIIFVWTPTENDEYWKSCFPFVWGKEDGGDSQDQHAQPEAVQLPEAYKSGDDKRLPGIPLKIILSQSRFYQIV